MGKRKKKTPHVPAHSKQKRVEKNYPESALTDAIKAVNDKKMTPFAASRKYRVPRTTIIDHVNGRYSSSNKNGYGPLLTPKAERELVKFINICTDRGIPVTSTNLKPYVRGLVIQSRRKTKMKPSGPSGKWLNTFMKRNRLSFKVMRWKCCNCVYM